MAVYTEVGEEELIAFVREYDIGHVLSCKGIAEGVENSNFFLQTDRGPFFLTLYEKRVKLEDLPFFLGLMDHLATKGIPCPTPVKGRDGSSLRQLNGRPAAIVSFRQGVWPRKPSTHHCAQVGRALAEFHIAGKDFSLRRGNDLSVAGWKRLLEQCAERADEIRPGLTRELVDEFGEVSTCWPFGLPAGIIHADLFPDNVLFVEGQLSALIDFYFACNDSFSYDLAICLNAWAFEGTGEFNVTKAQQLLQNYQKIRPLTQTERDALPLLARGAALRILLTRLYDWLHQIPGALVKPKDPLEYWKILTFHRQVKTVSAYGLV